MPTTHIKHYVATLSPSLLDTISEPVVQADGSVEWEPFDLTGSTVKLMAIDEATGLTVINSTAVVLNQTTNTGQVRYDWQSGDVASRRVLVCWWRVTLPPLSKTQDSPEFVVEMAEHGDVAAAPSVDTSGPCTVWASTQDIVTYAGADEALDESLTGYATEASGILYALSARQYPGECSRTVRPCNPTCSCWPVYSPYQQHPWSGDRCSFQRAVRLAGHVRSVTTVKIDGDVVSPTEYRVDQNTYLIRLRDTTTGVLEAWPWCQDMTLPDTEVGTFSVAYKWGRMPPIAGVRAAAQLAWQLWLSDHRPKKCALPPGWTSIARQGISINRQAIDLMSAGATGIATIDAFLASTNPRRLIQPPAVFSPDVQPYARNVGL